MVREDMIKGNDGVVGAQYSFVLSIWIQMFVPVAGLKWDLGQELWNLKENLEKEYQMFVG